MRRIVLAMLLISILSFSTSLWKQGGMNLLSVKKASDVGDIVRVVVQEIPTASAKLTDGNIFKPVFDFFSGIFKGFTKGSLTDYVPIDKTQDKVERKNELSAKVTFVVSATVVGKDENGNLIIKGRKVIKIGSEMRVIEIKGKARPQDIGPDNTINSSDLADAMIWIDGEVVYKKNPEEPDSWLSLILSSIANIFM